MQLMLNVSVEGKLSLDNHSQIDETMKISCKDREVTKYDKEFWRKDEMDNLFVLLEYNHWMHEFFCAMPENQLEFIEKLSPNS